MREDGVSTTGGGSAMCSARPGAEITGFTAGSSVSARSILPADT